MSKEDILEYAENSPLMAEMKKPQIQHTKHQRYGIRKLKNRIKGNRKVIKNG